MTSQAPPLDSSKAHGHRRLAARRRRVLRIRQAVAAAALSVFIALFSTVYVQMAAGKDPVLAAQGTTAGTTGSAASGTSTSAETGSADDGVPTETATEPAPVTTTQS
jgi:hypothetical protein